MSRFAKQTQENYQEQGIVLPIVALLLGVLIIFTALAIDTTMLASSKSRQRHIAQYMALGAVKAFSNTPGDNNTKLQAAVDRAKEFADDNTFISQAFMLPEAKSIGTNRVSSPAATHGILIPGIWYFQPQPTLCTNPDPRLRPCPCGTSPGVRTPCFRPLNFDLPSEANVIPNAMSVQIWTSATSPVRTVFARLKGLDNYTLGGQATAAITPRHGVFLLDLSRSAHGENFLAFESAPPTAVAPSTVSYQDSAEFAYRVTNIPGGSCVAGTNPCAPPPPCVVGPPSPYPAPNGCSIIGGIVTTLYNVEYNQYVRNCRLSTPLRPPERHYKTDYACYPISYSDNGSARNDNYLIDVYRGPTLSGNSRGPEPLSTMLEGMNYALQLVQTASVPGDLMGVIGFDMSAQIDIRRMDPAPSTDARYSGFLTTSDMTRQAPADLQQRFQQFGLFTRVESEANFPEALREARTMLRSAPDASSAENFVVMMSDGLTSCYRGRTCGADEKYFLNSQAEAMDILEHDYVGDHTRFHFLLLGDAVAPHTMLTTMEKNGVRSCMTEEQADLNNPPLNFVDASLLPPLAPGLPSPNWSQMSNGTAPSNLRYYAPNGFYRSVKKTQGYWFPIRPCCKNPANAPTCTASATVQAALTTACQATAPGIVPASGNQPVPVVAPPYTDGAGRLTCDVDGRDRKTQIQDAFDKIFGRSPYTLVQ